MDAMNLIVMVVCSLWLLVYLNRQHKKGRKDTALYRFPTRLSNHTDDTVEIGEPGVLSASTGKRRTDYASLNVNDNRSHTS